MIRPIATAARFCLILFSLSFSIFSYSQCAPAACSTSGTGSSLSGSGNHTIPANSTSIVASGNTWSGDLTFANANSVLCIDGTWTGKISASAPGAGTINVNGTVNNGTTWTFNGGGTVNINIKTGAVFTVSALNFSGSTFNIVNCGTLRFTGNSSSNGGTITIDNYGTLDLQGTFTNSGAGWTFNNKSTGVITSHVGGTAFSFSAGTFVNDGNYCFDNNIGFNGGHLTNNSCMSFNDFNTNTVTGFTNNGVIKVYGNFSNSGTGQVNNGEINILGNFSNSGSITLGDKSLITCANWTANGSFDGPASGMACMRATGTTNFSGTFSANSNHINMYDTGTPAATGTPAFPLDVNSGNVGSATSNSSCTTNSYANCAATCISLLPVELISFTGLSECAVNHLSWSTASETNNAFFTIEKSADGSSFAAIGTILGKGNSAVLQYYEFTDESASGETTYYRLKQTDHDGRFKTFAPIAVKADCAENETSCLRVYPNPASGEDVRLAVLGMDHREIKIEIQNIVGESVYSDRIIPDNGHFHSILRPEGKIAKGVYVITGRSGDKMCRTKCVIQ